MGRSKRQSQDERSGLTRTKLMDSAYNILLAEGHAGLRFSKVAEEAGVSRGGLLHHYPSKEELIAAVYERIIADLEDDARQNLADLHDEQLLSGLAKAAKTRFYSSSFRIVLDILIGSGEEEPVRKVREASYNPDRPRARLIFAERLAQTGISFKDADVVTQFVWGTVKGVAIRSFVRREDDLEERIIAATVQVAERHCEKLRKAGGSGAVGGTAALSN